MIDCVYYNDEIRCYRDGRVERYYRKKKYWKILKNIANSKSGYNHIKINYKMFQRHRILAFCFLGLENVIGSNGVGDMIDHIDRDKLNNAIYNLRITTNQGNQYNRSNCKGYSLDKASGKFDSRIFLNGKHIYLGRHATADEARQAYLDAKKIYHII